MEQNEQIDRLLRFLSEVEEDIKDEADKTVKIEHCINVYGSKPEECKVSCSYGDLVLIICMIKDYLKMIAEKKGLMWEYYRERFDKMADRFSSQIDYDYEKKAEACRKKMAAVENKKDRGIGEEALALAAGRGGRR